MTAPGIIRTLVDRFGSNIDQLHSTSYNETQIRREYIDPFFVALGWDVDNHQGFALPYREVIHEDSIIVAGGTKAPDYSFRIGGMRKFFVEAKKPSVNLKDDVSPAFQLRRYAWSAKLPLSILSDFEEFAVYDCRNRPSRTDKASNSRISYFTYTDFVDKWEEIHSVFSKEAVLHGSFDKYAEAKKGKKGTADVDDAFLAEIESWRSLLARNIALRNPRLSQAEINFAVQRTVDRIIFLRICEDRGIETYGRLHELTTSERTYKQLVELFRQADDKYNSGLFHFSQKKDRSESLDTFTLDLKIDDKVIRDIIGGLYYPESPYEFSVLPAEILGSVYERFLGKVIRLTKGHQAKIEEKPEVRKAGGVYYTPTYIVDHIVKNTVGKLVEGKTPREVSSLRVLDPACGSGSFLIGAYQYLLDWHRDWYAAHDPGRLATTKAPPVYLGPGGEWKLTTTERKKVLLNNMHGVDIDTQAVEVTKLSLLLKVLEGENEQTINAQLKMFHERALPDLGNNIKCGNSLIGPDFFDGQLIVDTEERNRINAFDWKAEFKEIMDLGGFDAVIGNPPYGMIGYEYAKPYYEDHYRSLEGRYDLYELFMEKGLQLLTREGRLGYIIPSPFLTNVYTRHLRQYILKRFRLVEINNFGIDVFSDPTVHTCIVVIEQGPPDGCRVSIRKQVKSARELLVGPDYEADQASLGTNETAALDVFADAETTGIFTKMRESSHELGHLCYIRQCIKTGDDESFVQISSRTIGEPWKRSLRGKSIGRYSRNESDLYVKYGEWLARNWKNASFYETPKLAIRETGKRVIATVDLENRYFLSSLYSVYPKSGDEKHSILYFLALLNSRIATFFLHVVAFGVTEGAFTKIRTNQLSRLPIHTIDFKVASEKARHDKLVSMVESMLQLHKDLAGVKTDQEKTAYQRQIDTTDKQIDALVYELYGLTEEEIKIVEAH